MALFGKSKPKQTEVHFLCSKTEQGFVVFIKHEEPPALHQIVGIKRIEETGTMLSRFKSKPSKMMIDSTLVDWSKFYCPWCGASKAEKGIHWVRCSACKTVRCTHTVEVIGGKPYSPNHGTCESKGFIQISHFELDGSKSSGLPSLKSVTATPQRKPLAPPDHLKITKK